jgi:hypothetical protein
LLEDKIPEVRRMAAWSLERLGRNNKLGKTTPSAALVERLKEEKDPGVRAAAWMAVGPSLKLDPDSIKLSEGLTRNGIAQFVELALQQKEFEIRSAGVLAARELEPARGLSLVKQVSGDASEGVRLNAIEFFASAKSKPGALALIDMLDAEEELRARWRIVDLLRGISGLAHRLDPRPWRDWANALPDDWHGEAKAATAPKDDGAQTTASFAGLPILSEHVCFVIDLSGSMWQKNKDGKTRKQVVDAELRKALESLPPSTEFNVIPYTSTPIPWSEHLAPADKKNVAKALDFFEGRKDNGTGNFWDAWMLALEDPNVDTVVMLSDGAPTGGHRWNLDLMRDLMAEHNRFRRVALDAVLADAKGALVAKWQAMCDDSGGRLVQIDLR